MVRRLSHSVDPGVADPYAELPVKNYKYVKNCTELYLACRGIKRLANFEGFANLEVLWINDNQIERLEGLDGCFRLKQLYAQNNRIRTLDGSSLPHFKFLRELRLYDNKLHDFPSTLSVLSRLRHLEDLDLFNNPLQEEDNYRLHIIRIVPSLLVLDRHVVTDEERARAGRLAPLRDEIVSTPLKANMQGPAKPRARQSRDIVAGAPPQTMSGTVRLLFKEVDAFRREEQV
ncbi:hypothetical protein PINS_up007250 [Pythium insidiosum]|nr:hypothetical protein PINS_up007250 [Pythium insidiosum]